MGNTYSNNVRNIIKILDSILKNVERSSEDDIWNQIRTVTISDKEQKQLKLVLNEFFQVNSSLLSNLKSVVGSLLIFVIKSLKSVRVDRIKDDKNLEFLLYFTKRIIKRICSSNNYLTIFALLEYSVYAPYVNKVMNEVKHSNEIYILYRDKYCILDSYKSFQEFRNSLIAWIRINFNKEYKSISKSGFVLLDASCKCCGLKEVYKQTFMKREIGIVYFLIPHEIPIIINDTIYSENIENKSLDSNAKQERKDEYSNSVLCNLFIEFILFCIYSMEAGEEHSKEGLPSFLKIQGFIFDIFFYMCSVNIQPKYIDDKDDENSSEIGNEKEENKYSNNVNRQVQNENNSFSAINEIIQSKAEIYSPNILFFEVLFSLANKLHQYNHKLFLKITHGFLSYLINILYNEKCNVRLDSVVKFKNQSLSFLLLCLFYKGNITGQETENKIKNKINIHRTNAIENSMDIKNSLPIFNENKDNIYLLTFKELCNVQKFENERDNSKKSMYIQCIDFERVCKIFIDSANHIMNIKNTNDILLFEHVYFLLLYVFLYKNKKYPRYFFNHIDHVQIYIFMIFMFLKMIQQIIYTQCSFSKNDVHLITLLLIIFVIVLREKGMEDLFKNQLDPSFLKHFEIAYDTTYGNILLFTMLKLGVWNYKFLKNIFILELIYAIINNMPISFALDFTVTDYLVKNNQKLLTHMKEVIQRKQEETSSFSSSSSLDDSITHPYNLQIASILFKTILLCLCKNMNHANPENLRNLIYTIFQQININEFNNDLNRIFHFYQINENSKDPTFQYILKSFLPYLTYIKMCVLYFYNQLYQESQEYQLQELQILIKDLVEQFSLSSTTTFNENRFGRTDKNNKEYREKNTQREIPTFMQYYPKDIGVIRFKYDEDLYSIYFFYPYICNIIKIIRSMK